MSLVLTARLVMGTFDAGARDSTAAEWPPHPLRLFSALVDAASHLGWKAASIEALRWLEELEPPQVWAAGRCEHSVRAAYVPVNDLPDRPRHTLYPGRVAAGKPKSWPRAIPASDTVRFLWRDAQPDAPTLTALGELAATVPYFGRASSPVVLSVDGGDLSEHAPDGELWSPDESGNVALRVPFSGALDALRAAFDAGQLVHDVSREAPYRIIGQPTAPPAHIADDVTDGPYEELLSFVMRPAPGLDAAYTLAITSQLRRAVIRLVGTDVPAAVHGHDHDSPHVAWLALPFVDHEHASGRVLGTGVALPRAMPATDRATLLRVLLGAAGEEGLRWLALPPPLSRLGTVALRRWSGDPDPEAARPERWTSPRRRWASVTPVIWDRFTHDDEKLEAELVRSIVRAGYPEPAAGGLAWSRSPFVRGAAQPRPHQIRREGDPPRQYRHVMVEFPTRVRGPVLVGQMRHFGVGLFVPVGPE